MKGQTSRHKRSGYLVALATRIHCFHNTTNWILLYKILLLQKTGVPNSANFRRLFILLSKHYITRRAIFMWGRTIVKEVIVLFSQAFAIQLCSSTLGLQMTKAASWDRGASFGRCKLLSILHWYIVGVAMQGPQGHFREVASNYLTLVKCELLSCLLCLLTSSPLSLVGTTFPLMTTIPGSPMQAIMTTRK